MVRLRHVVVWRFQRHRHRRRHPRQGQGRRQAVDAANRPAPGAGSRGAVAMTALTAALAHAALDRPVFPVNAKKTPIIDDWPNRATTDPAQIERWWTEWPFALIGTP